ncbi:hypothetical protein GOEFS_106_00930 [Gordonia effusa NBRC 100432]|uniref:MmpS family membrane protein n=1 Tax=Gordonia effusa NBRC 100432 TaxID=1077974 RepID=H0R544_9ACTN|nr:MmpS family transport accessory protein [Gordonia effusa]GAB20195.1 hypothetical protein GOEFS_106_00930 [Gordonia effusa NBRC 100432]
MTNPPPPQPYPGQPYPQQPYPAPPKKKAKWPWILLALVVVFLALVGGCVALVGGAANEVANEIDKQSNSEVVVTYKVTGDGGKASITYTGTDTNMGQDTAASLPWEKKVTLKGFAKLASVSASNDFDAAASTKITCEVLVDGKVKFTQTGTGPGATASCSGSVD